jgi:hypothetical protein
MEEIDSDEEEDGEGEGSDMSTSGDEAPVFNVPKKKTNSDLNGQPMDASQPSTSSAVDEYAEDSSDEEVFLFFSGSS